MMLMYLMRIKTIMIKNPIHHVGIQNIIFVKIRLGKAV